MSRDDVSVRTDLRAVLAALRELDPLERAVFQLCAVDGLDYPEIAERLGIGPVEVERFLASALLAIDRHLDVASRARNPVESGAKRRANRLHRLMRWLGLP
ncbi:sigma-70 region 4 domain-containing protein [Sphingomonas psychrotolerans]|uniref:Sigma-70 region 4 domain-containing protein n=1 Tax=Sphingomonas psychrotolerans TaxID=1327635 RepID=A0ABU3N7Q1_9SPHN|nr:sigma-70 region 4 domain-containing protein [Sphingomonas psychrotolerans]MDT8760542.1 sigma-70 region 4 domain-containing protein [Sphingomonas psychrotolerans]